MKIPFDIKFRPQIESGEYKVETLSGYPVTIYRWDFDDGARTPIMGSYVSEDSKEYVCAWNKEGRFDVMSPSGLDLFIITPEPELTSWQTFISGCLQKHGFLDCGAADRIAKECSAELLDLARKELEQEWPSIIQAQSFNAGLKQGKAEALKDLPRWKKVGADTGQINLYNGFLRTQNYLEVDGRRIMFSELEKLPGFKED